MPDNRPGVQYSASDSDWKSDHLWYLLISLDRPKYVSNSEIKQTNRTHRKACRQADILPSRWTRSTFQIMDQIASRGSPHLGKNILALKWLSPNIDPPVPWQRVIASSGAISSRGPGTDGAQRQRNALEAEGVEVTDGRAGEMRVDLRTYGWFPNALEGQAGNERDGDM